MAETVSDFLVKRLTEWGIQQVYGYSGDGINPILGAIDRAGNQPEFIPTPHEEFAALMACAHAKFTGTVGVCLATQGPGAIHLLNGLYDAKLDHQPVLAIVGQQSRSALGGQYQQEVDLLSLFKDVAGAYIEMVTSPEQVRHVLDRALRIAAAERTVTCVIVPHDLQRMDAVEEPSHKHGMLHSGVGYPPTPRVVPTEAELRRAADVLNAGQKVAMLIGAGALSAPDDVVAVAERLGAGVAKALLGKAAVPDDLPFVTGSVGWLGTAPSNTMMEECDTLLMVGSNFPYTEFLPKEGQARGVQIDINGRMLSSRYPMEVNLIGDSAQTLQALLPFLEAKSDTSWRERIEEMVRQWWQTLDEQAQQPGEPLNPQRIFSELSPRLPDNVILTGDSGSSTVWYARYLKIKSGMMASLSGTLATMGSAVPYALAAKFAHSQRPVIAIAGDGAMQMNGLNGLIWIAQFWQRWRNPQLIVLVLNNRDLNYVTWEQRVMEGMPRVKVAQNLPDFPYAQYAEMLGLKGIRVDTPDRVAAAWDEALASDRPVVFEAVTDPNIPTVPPQLKTEQAQKLRQALAGDADAAEVMRGMTQIRALEHSSG